MNIRRLLIVSACIILLQGIDAEELRAEGPTPDCPTDMVAASVKMDDGLTGYGCKRNREGEADPWYGPFEARYESGALGIAGQYDGNGKTGTWTYWYPDGTLRGTQEWNDGARNGIYKSFYSSGAKKEIGEYEEGRIVGEWRQWNEDGTLWRIVSFRDEHKYDTSFEWYSENNKKFEANFIDDKLEGVSTWWYPNGKKARQERYSDGKQNGWSISWDEDGNVITKVLYRDGIMTKTKVID